MEALRCGVPLLGMASCNLHIVDGVNGLLVSGVDGLAAQIERAVRDTALLRALKAGASAPDMDPNEEMLQAVVVPVKLNNVVCILRLLREGAELDDSTVEKGDGEAETWLDRAEELCNEVIKMEPRNAKAQYRKSQVLEFRTDISGAERCLDEVEKLEGKTATLRAARQRLRDCRKAERMRERELYAGFIQESSVHKVAEAAVDRQEDRRRLVLRVSHMLAAPVTYPGDLLLRFVLQPAFTWVVSPLWHGLCRLTMVACERLARKLLGDDTARELFGDRATAREEPWQDLHED